MTSDQANSFLSLTVTSLSMAGFGSVRIWWLHLTAFLASLGCPL